MNEEALSHHPHLDPFQLHRNEQDPKELRKPQQAAMGGAVKVQPARTLFSIQNSTKPTNLQRSNPFLPPSPAPRTPRVAFVFPLVLWPLTTCEEKWGFVHQHLLEQGAIFFPRLRICTLSFSPELQFPLALETDTCSFQSHGFLVRRGSARTAQALQTNTCGHLHSSRWTQATFSFFIFNVTRVDCHPRQAA